MQILYAMGIELSTQYKVRQCSQCQGDTEFYCHTCKLDLCIPCKKKHMVDKNTKYHHVVYYITRHTEKSFTTQCKVRQCSQCQGDTEFYCHTCKHDLCLPCKERHVIDLDTMHHDVVIYREKFYIQTKEICVRHPDSFYKMFCQSCELPVCFRCTEHQNHKKLDIVTGYQTKRQQHREIIDNIRSETLYNCHILLARNLANIKTCHTQIGHRRVKIFIKAQRLKDLIDTVVREFCSAITKVRHLKRNIVEIQDYEDRLEQSANRAVQFLLFIKNNPQNLWLVVTEGSGMENLSQLLREISEIQMITEKQELGIDKYLKFTSTPVRRMSNSVTGVSRVHHISRVTANQIWVSDPYNCILADITKGTEHYQKQISSHGHHGGGVHTVTGSSELIYITDDRNIYKLSADSKKVELVLNETPPWISICVYHSPSSGDLIIGMYNSDTGTGKVSRYNSTGTHCMTLRYDISENLYTRPLYITENKNGDVIVSDCGRSAVVVTDRVGKYRFSYTGPPSGLSLGPLGPLEPLGICTDALSNILVCDHNTRTVQMIDKNGQFKLLLLTPQHDVHRPHSLSYDHKTHLLWVGSQYSNTVSVYRYIQRRYSLTEMVEVLSPDNSDEQYSRWIKDLAHLYSLW